MNLCASLCATLWLNECKSIFNHRGEGGRHRGGVLNSKIFTPVNLEFFQMSDVHPNAAREVSDYIEGMPEFARAICNKLRVAILEADPNIVEDWKWGPHYSFQGMICGYGAFKHHVKFTFYNGSAMKDPRKLFNHCVDNEFNRSIKYTDVQQVDEKAIVQYVRESVEVNRKGFKRTLTSKQVHVPDDLRTALFKNTDASNFFEKLTRGYQNEFIEWITSAKRQQTRIDRIARVVTMCRDNRRLNDQYK